jgi:hypothetical protein
MAFIVAFEEIKKVGGILLSRVTRSSRRKDKEGGFVGLRLLSVVAIRAIGESDGMSAIDSIGSVHTIDSPIGDLGRLVEFNHSVRS